MMVFHCSEIRKICSPYRMIKSLYVYNKNKYSGGIIRNCVATIVTRCNTIKRLYQRHENGWKSFKKHLCSCHYNTKQKKITRKLKSQFKPIWFEMLILIYVSFVFIGSLLINGLCIYGGGKCPPFRKNVIFHILLSCPFKILLKMLLKPLYNAFKTKITHQRCLEPTKLN